MIRFIDENKHDFGVEPICEEMQIAPSTYYATTSRPPSKRSKTDEETVVKITDVHKKNDGVYGARKVHANSNTMATPSPAARSNGSCAVKCCAASPDQGVRGPRFLARSATARKAWCGGRSRRQRRTACGLPKSPTSEHSRAGFTRPSSSACPTLERFAHTPTVLE